MVELHDVEMKEANSTGDSNLSNATTTSKDERKDADTLTLEG